MRKFFFLSVMAFSFLLVSPFAYAEKVTVATFNCEFLTRPKVHVKFDYDLKWRKVDPAVKKQWEDQAFRDGKFAEAVKAVAQVIKLIDADVLVLTEVGRDKKDVKELYDQVQKLGLQYKTWAAADSKDTGTRQNVAVFSRFELKDIEKHISGREGYLKELDDPESEADTGISKGMRVEVDMDGHDVVLYAVHFKAETGGHEADAQRIAQASIVRRHVLEDLADGDNVIVAGDMNDKPGQPALLRVRGLDDIWEDLIQTGHVAYFKKAGLDTRWTYVYSGQRQQIDHVLISRSLKDACKSPKVEARTLDHNDDLASDHKPFIVDLNFR